MRSFLKQAFTDARTHAQMHNGHKAMIKISRTIFEKGHPRNIPVKLFPNRTRGFKEDFLRISEFLYVDIVQKVSPLHGGHFFRWIKILQTSFKKGHPRNNPVKLFQNLTSGFRGEEF